MEMWLKQATLAVLTVAAAAMAISPSTSVLLNNITTTTKEKRVEVPVGSTLTLYCCLDPQSRAWMYWYFEPFGKSSNSSRIFLAKKMINTSGSNSVVECQDSEKKHILLVVNETDSGFYYCEVQVDIPIPLHNKSKKKEVVITESIVESTTSFVTSQPENPSDSWLQMEWWMWVLLGVSAFVLLVLIVVCILLRKCSKRSGAMDPIYANTHSKGKGSSPRPEMNHLKTVSSSQNLRTPSPGQRYGEGKRRPRQ